MTARLAWRTGILIVAVLLLGACGGGSGGGGGGGGNLSAPIADLTGTWSVTESISGNCPTNPETETYTGTAEHTGNSATFHKPAIPAFSSAAIDFSFTVSSDNVVLATSRSYGKRGGTVTVSRIDLSISNQGNTLSGSTAWSWSNGIAQYDCSGTSAFTATRTTGTGAIPTAPSNTLASTISSSSIDVSWTDLSTNESSFVLERSTTSASGYAALPVVIPAAASSGSTVHYTDSGLAAGTTYYYRAKARNINGDSTYSPVANATTLNSGGGAVPMAPSGLTITSVTSRSISLMWVDNAANEAGFSLERAPSCTGQFTEIFQAAADRTGMVNTSLSPETFYCYRIRAYNGAGYSDYSNTASATTLKIGPVLSGPASSTGSITLTWTFTWSGLIANQAGYQLQQSTTASTVGFSDIFNTSGQGVPDTQSPKSYKISRTPGTYYYRVRAVINIGQYSDWSNVTTVVVQ